MSWKPIQEEEDRYQLPTYAKLPTALERGNGCYVYDSDGNQYLDFYAGHAVVSTGHCHPRVVDAIREQAGKLIFYSNVTYNGIRARASRRLLEMAGEPFYQTFLASSGSEANENAIKLARAQTGRRELISLEGSFHGRTYGSLSATGIAKYPAYLNTPVPGHRILPAQEVAAAVSQETAAVLVEPIQSMGGVREIPASVLSDISQACRRHGSLLIYDEVQTGVGRTGRFLYSGLHDIYPDMVTLAKGIASGFPASALLVTEELARGVKSGDLGTTFGGGQLACAALKATLDVIQEEQLVENAAIMGTYLTERLEAMEGVAQILGRGLLLGIRWGREGAAKALQKGLRERGILTGSSTDPTVLRLMPPLVVQRNEVDTFLEAVAAL